jgi:hypothetical protein
MTCTPLFTKEELELMLRQAKMALHNLMMGKQAVEVRDQNGESVKYTRSTKKDLEDYIQYLENQIGCRNVLRPIEFFL